ncbi:unnamed protein product [Lymnaea stagnalis]|uniref:Uncharacterized protein n=1 Tax=Lymnaea stagnalis TaxID=6523 RepID=A0AAV2IGB3_LYMST
MEGLQRTLTGMISKLRSHRKQLYRKSVFVCVVMFIFMAGTFSMTARLPPARESYSPYENTKSYVIKIRNAAPFPVWVDLMTVDSIEGRDIADDTNILKNVAHDEALDMKPGDFYHVDDVQVVNNADLNLRYEDLSLVHQPKVRLAHGQVRLRMKSSLDAQSQQLQAHGQTESRLVRQTESGSDRRLVRHKRSLENSIRSNVRTGSDETGFHRNKDVESVLGNRNSMGHPADGDDNRHMRSRGSPSVNKDSDMHKDQNNKEVQHAVTNTQEIIRSYGAHKNMSRRLWHFHKKNNQSEISPATHQPEIFQGITATVKPQRTSEHYDVVFIKVHKAASTTVHNVMMRFALSRQLDVMLPKRSNIITEMGSLINPDDILPSPPNLKFNMICNHIVYNRGQISNFMKSPDRTVYIGIVREPFEQFVSAFYYYLNTFQRPLLVQIAMDHPRNPIRGFLDNPLKYVDVPKYDYGVTYINNRMSTDFGFPMWNLETDKHRDDFIKKFLKDTAENFDLVLVVDMFEESLVMMRRLLRWKVKDILYIRANTKSEAEKAQNLHFPWKTNVQFSVDDVKNHRLYSPVDHALYDYFKALLVEKIKNQPPDFTGEVKMLKVLLKDVASFCETLEEESLDLQETELLVPGNQWTDGFKVSSQDCRLLKLSELDMIDLARRTQEKKYNS